MSTQSTTDSGWQLQGNAAEAYESYLVPVIFRGLAERLVAAAENVFEMGLCGLLGSPGLTSRTASETAGHESDHGPLDHGFGGGG